MRHLRAGRKLTADTQHRLAMRRNLARAIFLNGRIVTTMAKAKATRPFVEKLVTRARKAVALRETNRGAYIHQLRVLRRDIPERRVLKLLVDSIAPLCMDRPGGYTRIMRDAKNQLGDNAPRAIWEFVDRPVAAEDRKSSGKTEKKKGKKKGAAAS